nr:retrotransposon protein, putative, Ty1-copia subclass [Tanacetum cinerariifolium]
IASVEIIDRQLPFEYTIASRSTDVMVPIPPAPIAHSAANVLAEWNAAYDAHNEVACLMLESMTPELHRQFENSSPYEMLQKLKSMFEKQAGVESVGLILNGLTSDFAGFVRNYNTHNMGKTIGELHAMLIEYEKGLPKKAATPQVMAIHGGRIQKANKKSNGIYEIDMSNSVPNVNSIYNVSNKRVNHNLDSTYLWHCRLAHISKKHIGKLQHDGLLKSTDDESFDQCVSCLSGKMTRKSFSRRPKRAANLLGLIHTDVCGPLRHVSRQDRGGEYISQEFKDYLKAYGIVQQLTPPYTPQHNGVSERRNRTLLDMVRSMMNLTTLPLSFWDYALESVARILNMVPTKKVDETPYELWFGKVPNLSYLKVWGFEALVKRDTPEKLQQRSVKCICIGYPKETMGYYFYFSPKNKIVVARYVEFFEKNSLSQEVSGRAGDLEEIQDEDTSPSEITSEIPMEVKGFEPPQEEEAHVRRSKRPHQNPNRLCLNVEVEEHSLGNLNEPINYKAAILDPESNKWLDAINTKMQSMKDNQVWRLVDLPPDCKTIGSELIFKKKTDMDGNVHTYKARLVAKDLLKPMRLIIKKHSHPLLTLELLGFS